MTESLSAGTAFLIAADASVSIHDNGAVFLNTGTGRILTTNATGARVWRGLERQETLAAIAAALSDAYGVALATSLEDTTRFVALLEREKLVARSAGR